MIRTKPDDGVKNRIITYLESNCVGRSKAISGDKLTLILGLSDKRLLRAAIHELRAGGAPILSNSTKPAGYFIPETPDEANDALNELTSRVIQLRESAKGIRAGLEKRFPGAQIKINYIGGC